MAYLQFILVCLFFGANFILMDRANRWFGPVEVGMGRLLSAAILLIAVWMLFDRRSRLRWRDLRNILLVALVANSYPYVAQPAFISQGFGHSFFGMTISFTPLLTILVSIPLLGIRPTARQLVGVLLGLGFIALLMQAGSLRGIGVGTLLLATTVPLSYAVGNTWLRRTLSKAPSVPLTGSMMGVAALGLLPVLLSSPLQEGLGIGPPEARTDATTAVVALITLGAIGTGACAWMFINLVQKRGPLFAGMVTYVVPVIAMLWGVVDGEKITTQQVIAIGGILSMVALVQAPQRRTPVLEEVVPRAPEESVVAPIEV